MARYQMGRLKRGLPVREAALDIAGLERSERGAMKVAREISVDYARHTEFENRYLRGLLLPFYAWPRQNTPNWLRWMWGAKIGALTLLGLRLLMEAWNNWDEDCRIVEQSLPPYKRQSAHIVTGWLDGDGKMLVVYWTGDPQVDALGWLGVASGLNRLSDVATSRLTLSNGVRNQLGAFVKEPGQRAVGLLTPALKVPVELATGVSSLTGQPISPRTVQGLPEETWRKTKYAAESLVRPLREARLLGEAAGKEGGVNLLTNRFGPGLPMEKVDVAEAQERVEMQIWREGRAEFVEQVRDALTQDPGFGALRPHQQGMLLELKSREAEAEWNKHFKAPSTRKQRFERKWNQ